jgi:hypothetical protein
MLEYWNDGKDAKAMDGRLEGWKNGITGDERAII